MQEISSNAGRNVEERIKCMCGDRQSERERGGRERKLQVKIDTML